MFYTHRARQFLGKYDWCFQNKLFQIRQKQFNNISFKVHYFGVQYNLIIPQRETSRFLYLYIVIYKKECVTVDSLLEEWNKQATQKLFELFQ